VNVFNEGMSQSLQTMGGDSLWFRKTLNPGEVEAARDEGSTLFEKGGCQQSSTLNQLPMGSHNDHSSPRERTLGA